MSEKVVVGVSGGIDSATTLYLLKEKGYDPIGVTLLIPSYNKKLKKFTINNTENDFQIKNAKKVCENLNVKHNILDLSKDFKDTVINYFLEDLKNNRTPNPCTYCNKYFKFKHLFDFADKNNIKYVSTGHYARVEKNKLNFYELKVAKDKSKDQTYGLSLLDYDCIKRLILPLGNYYKSEVYKIANKNNLEFFKNVSQSQDLCFLKNISLNDFLLDYLGENKGDIISIDNKVLGKHKGLYFYTLGQRKGIGLNEKLFVLDKDLNKNQLIVTNKPKQIFAKKLFLKKYNLINFKIDSKKELYSRTRYQQKLTKCFVSKKDDVLVVEFLDKQKFVAIGQFCVFYKSDVCLGGGIIDSFF